MLPVARPLCWGGTPSIAGVVAWSGVAVVCAAGSPLGDLSATVSPSFSSLFSPSFGSDENDGRPALFHAKMQQQQRQMQIKMTNHIRLPSQLFSREHHRLRRYRWRLEGMLCRIEPASKANGAPENATDIIYSHHGTRASSLRCGAYALVFIYTSRARLPTCNLAAQPVVGIAVVIIVAGVGDKHSVLCQCTESCA